MIKYDDAGDSGGCPEQSLYSGDDPTCERFLDRDIDQVAEYDRYDLTKPQCNDGKVVAAQTQGRCAKDEAKKCGNCSCDPDHDPEIDVDIMKGGGKDTCSIGSDGKECGITQVEQAGITYHNIQ